MTQDRIPKALLPVAGVPIALRQMEALAREGIRAVTILAGHLGERLALALVAQARRLSLTMDVIVEREPLGTAGCLTALRGRTHDTLIVYGDMLFEMDLSRLTAFHRQRGAMATIVAHPNDHPETSDLLVERDGLVRAVLPAKFRRKGDFRNLVPAGLFLATPQFLEQVTPGVKADLILDSLPRLLAQGKSIAVYNTPEYLRDIGTPDRHALAEADIANGRVARESLRRRRTAIFFDIDGTLAEEPGGHGVLSPDQVALLSGAAEALKRAVAAGYLTVAVTNRPQLAKGLVTEDGLDAIFGRLECMLARDQAWLNRIYYCPHHPEAGRAGEVAALKIACRCRKPAPGLLEEAARDLNIDLRNSVLIGDSLRDIGAAQALHIPGLGVRTGYGCRDTQRYPGLPPKPAHMFDDVLEAVNFMTAQQNSQATP